MIGFYKNIFNKIIVENIYQVWLLTIVDKIIRRTEHSV
jgi:hypothetical protein